MNFATYNLYISVFYQNHYLKIDVIKTILLYLLLNKITFIRCGATKTQMASTGANVAAGVATYRIIW